MASLCADPFVVAEFLGTKKESKMKFLFLGNYSNAGLAGFLKNPEDDRRAAISGMVEKSGGKFIDLQFLRGKYDIAVVAEVSSFEDAAAVKVLVAASGALDRLEMMEYIDMNDIATRASKITGAYRAPGDRA